jgi:cyclase
MSHMSNKKALLFGLATGLVLATSAPVLAQQPPAPVTVELRQLKPNVYVGLGAGGNSTVIIGNTSVIVVDAKTSEAGAKALLAEIAKVTPKPVTTVFLTHSDGDHVNGLVAYPANVKVIAHPNNRKELEAAIAAGGRGAPPPDRLPSQLVSKNGEMMTLDGVRLMLHHYGPSHTSGDLVVHLPDQRIVATGDIIAANRADDNPNIHPEKNGSTENWLATVKGIIAIDADIFVPGHGEMQTKADLQRKLTASTERRAKIVAMVKEGRSVADIKAALPDAPAPGAAPRAGGAPAGGGGRQGGTPNPTYVDWVVAEIKK